MTCTAATWAADIPGAQLYRAPQTVGIEWIRDGAAMHGATGTSFTPTSGGIYACRASASNFAGTGTATSAAFVVPASSPSGAGLRLGKLVKNKKKGTARLTVTVGSAGAIALGGPAVQRVRGRTRAATKLILPVRAKGGARKKLAEKGRTKLKLAVTFMPSGGKAEVKRRTVTLVRLERKR